MPYNPPTNDLGLYLPKREGDELDDVTNWAEMDRMMRGQGTKANLAAIDSQKRFIGAGLDAAIKMANGRPSVWLNTDSQGARALQVPLSTYRTTINKGSFPNGSNVITTGGVPGGINSISIDAQGRVHVGWRTAPNFLNNDHMFMYGVPAGTGRSPLNTRQYKLTLVSSTDYILNDPVTGLPISAEGVEPWSSGSAAVDAMGTPDMCWSTDSHVTWAMIELGFPFVDMEFDCVSGRTTAEIAAAARAKIPGFLASGRRFTIGWAIPGHNDTFADLASLQQLRDDLLLVCDFVYFNTVWAHSTWTDPGSAATEARFNQYGQAIYEWSFSNPRVIASDTRGVLSDPTKPLEASDSNLLSSDGTHGQANGMEPVGRRCGKDLARSRANRQRRLTSRFKSANLLTGARYYGRTATGLPAGFTGKIPTNFGLVKSTNVSAGYSQVFRFPSIERNDSMVVAEGDTFSVDGRIFGVMSVTGGGALASSLPAIYRSYNVTGTTSGGAAPYTVTGTGVPASTPFNWTGFADGEATVMELTPPVDPEDDDAERITLMWYVGFTVSTEVNNDRIEAYQLVTAAGQVVEGDNLVGEWQLAAAGGPVKSIRTALSYHTSNTVPLTNTNQLAIAQSPGPATFLTRRQTRKQPKLRPYRTRKLPVPANVTHIAHCAAAIGGLGTSHIWIALPMVEKNPQ